MSEKPRINRSSACFAVGILLIVGGMIRLTLAILSPITDDFQMVIVVASTLATGLGVCVLLALLLKLLRSNQGRLNVDDGEIRGRKVRAGLSIGPSVIAMGTSIAALSIAAHNPVAKLIIMGGAIFIMIMGIIISVVNIAKMKKAKEKSA